MDEYDIDDLSNPIADEIDRLKKTAENIASFYEVNDSAWINMAPFATGIIRKQCQTGSYIETIVHQYFMFNRDMFSIADMCDKLSDIIPIEQVWDWSKQFDAYIAKHEETNYHIEETIVMLDGSIKKIETSVDGDETYGFFNPTFRGEKVRLSNRFGKPEITIEEEKEFDY